MHPTALQTLVVESNFSSRKELVSLLQATLFIGEIQQAPSVRDAVTTMSAGRTDVCVLGSSLSLQRATWLIETAKTIPLKKPCALIAVAKSEEDFARLNETGIDGTLRIPLEPMTFTEMVQRAVEHSRARFGGPLTTRLEKSTVTPILELGEGYENGLLADVINELSMRLEALAKELSGGRLKLSANGLPSLAAQDALRLVLESAFPKSSAVAQIGSDNHRFVTALVEWFVERVQSGQKEAAEKLRRRLVENARVAAKI